jgi:hypothetical protein
VTRLVQSEWTGVIPAATIGARHVHRRERVIVMRHRWASAVAGIMLAIALAAAGLACESSTSKRTYVPAPVPIGEGATILSAGTGSARGGTRVVITGRHLTGLRTVCFGSLAATGVTANAADTRLTVTTPAGTGTVKVFVITARGASQAARFEFTGSAIAGAAVATPAVDCQAAAGSVRLSS